MSARNADTIRWRPNLTLDIDVDDEVRYTWHWQDRIKDGEEISHYEFVVAGEGEVSAHAQEGKSIMSVVRGIGKNARTRVTCRVFTSGNPPEKLDRSITFVGRQH